MFFGSLVSTLKQELRRWVIANCLEVTSKNYRETTCENFGPREKVSPDFNILLKTLYDHILGPLSSKSVISYHKEHKQKS